MTVVWYDSSAIGGLDRYGKGKLNGSGENSIDDDIACETSYWGADPTGCAGSLYVVRNLDTEPLSANWTYELNTKKVLNSTRLDVPPTRNALNVPAGGD